MNGFHAVDFKIEFFVVGKHYQKNLHELHQKKIKRDKSEFDSIPNL